LLFIWDNVCNSQKLQHLLKKALGTVCTMPVPSVAAVPGAHLSVRWGLGKGQIENRWV